jgi:hypothetical protein
VLVTITPILTPAPKPSPRQGRRERLYTVFPPSRDWEVGKV